MSPVSTRAVSTADWVWCGLAAVSAARALNNRKAEAAMTSIAPIQIKLRKRLNMISDCSLLLRCRGRASCVCARCSCGAVGENQRIAEVHPINNLGVICTLQTNLDIHSRGGESVGIL